MGWYDKVTYCHQAKTAFITNHLVTCLDVAIALFLDLAKIKTLHFE